MNFDYRESHKDATKGESYHSQFFKNPYRSLMWEMEQRTLDRILSKYFRPQAVRHLDFACGTGRILEHLARSTKASVGVDVSDSMLNVARQRLKNCEIIKADITREDVLGTRTFNLITAFRFFPNAQEDLRKEAINALVSHLSDDGYLIFNNHKNYTSAIYSLGRLLSQKKRGEMRSDEVYDLIQNAGLKVVDTYHLGVIPATDRIRVLPIFLIRPLDTFLSRLNFLQPLASNVIYVCKRATSAESNRYLS